MRKLYALVICLLFMVNISLPAFSAETEGGDVITMIPLIDMGLEHKIEVMPQNALGLNLAEDPAVLEPQGPDVLVPFLLNLFVGFGIGSFVQGNLSAAFMQLLYEWIGVGLIYIGLLLGQFLGGLLGAWTGEYMVFVITNILLSLPGLGFFVYGKVTGLIMTVQYPDEFKKKWQGTLHERSFSTQATSPETLVQVGFAF